MPPTSQTAIVAAIVPTSLASASAARITKPTDFDAIQSIPFDDDGNVSNHMTSIGSSSMATVAIDGDGDTLPIDSSTNNAHAGVLKKLTSYFSSSPKTLINLNLNNHSSKNGCKKMPPANTSHTTDTCAVFENMNAVQSSPVSSSSTSSLSSAASSLPLASSSSSVAIATTPTPTSSDVGIDRSKDRCRLHRLPSSSSDSSGHSSARSSSLSANSINMLCGDKRDVDKCDEILNKNNKITIHKNNKNIIHMHKSGKSASGKKHDKIDYGVIDGATTATSIVTKARSPNKRAQKIDGNNGGSTATGDSFTLPRVVLRQR